MKITKKILLFIFILTYHQQTYPHKLLNDPVKVAFTVGLSKYAYDVGQQILPTVVSGIGKLQDYFKQKEEKNYAALLKIRGGISVDSTMHYCAILQNLAKDPNVKGIILNIESPGGDAGAGHFLYQEIKDFTKLKPVIVATTSYCYSAAYNVACGANWIITSKQASIGGIGVFTKISRFTDKITTTIDNNKGEIQYDYIKAGKYKAIDFSDYPEKLSDEERKLFQSRVDTNYEVFCTTVAQERKLDLNKKEEWADGKIFIAPQALSLGLIDQIGSLNDAKAKMLELIQEYNANVKASLEIIEV